MTAMTTTTTTTDRRRRPRRRRPWFRVMVANFLGVPTTAVVAVAIATITVTCLCHYDRRVAAATTANPRRSPPPLPLPLPHILFVLIDDLGWGDVGFHYIRDGNKNPVLPKPKEVQTPVMDRLALHDGLQLNRHYVHHSCTGTRVALQSGRFPVHVQTTLKNPEDPSSGMPRNLKGLAQHLQNQTDKGNHGKYATHYVGKWDVGMATPRHTPHGRGYDTSLHYFEHKNDYWTHQCLQSKCCPAVFKLQQEQENVTTTTRPPLPPMLYDLWDTDRPARQLVGSDFEEFVFERRMHEILDRHVTAKNHRLKKDQRGQETEQKTGEQQQDQPLFLFYAPHVAHCPLQVPQSYLDDFEFMDHEDIEFEDGTACSAQTHTITDPTQKHSQPKFSCRKQYHAMVKLLDDILGRLVEKFKTLGLWNNTLMVITSDNGGPVVLEESAATNWPLRGGKYSDWEGGVRATALVSGGYVPAKVRGTVVEHPIHIADWYATLPALAGIDVRHEEQDKKDSKVPPVDAINVWPFIVGEQDKADGGATTKTSSSSPPPPPRPPREIPLSQQALIVGDYKLIWNRDNNVTLAGWTSPHFPTRHSTMHDVNQTVDCREGCLYNVATDPGEHVDLASADPTRVQQMKSRLQELRRGFYDNDERGVDSCPKDFVMKGGDGSDDNLPCACWMAVNYYGGFLGPYQEVELLPPFLDRLSEKDPTETKES